MSEHPSSGQAKGAALVRFLSRPASYPHRPATVRRIETHSAWIFLAGPWVYKVKKPVRLGFLDFSTLERRRHFCGREVSLNRRLCPDLYRGVIPIVRLASGRLSLGGGGRVVEYAVLMKRMDERRFLDVLVDRGRAGTREVERVVRRLERFYSAHPSRPEVAAWGRIPALRISTRENFRQAAPFVGRTLSAPALDAIREFTDRFYDTQRELLRSRVDGGWIRDCHGDLHLEHIHLTPSRVRIFDCIEFNDRFRYIDIASDAAFLAMDLDHHGRFDLARHFMARLARDLRDSDLPRLADFYKCYRAFVRGKVESLQMDRLAEGERARHRHQERARRYFALALRYAVLGTDPAAVVCMGRVGAGKSHLAAALGEVLGCAVYGSDRLRKRLAGVRPDRRPGRSSRERLYGAAMTRRTYRALAAAGVGELRRGRCVVLDATFSREEERRQIMRRVGSAGGRIVFVEALASRSLRGQRLRGRERAAGGVSDARLEDMPKLDGRYETTRGWDPGMLVRCRCEGDLDRALGRLLRRLATRQARGVIR